ncbi:MAG: helix-turn-helix transcriptional regulator [Candidatus Paceibacterota bacterium]|jgi:transcriptional regulator with XRE-family HTH domain
MSRTINPSKFKKLRKKLGLSIQAVALEMMNQVSFSTLYNFEHGMPVSDKTKEEINKWITTKN